MTVAYRCPHCAESLNRAEGSYICPNRHCFDVAKQGYVNLLRSKGSGNHGDDKGMVQARCAFLEAGYYAPLRDRLCETVLSYGKDGFRLLDAGCGEGYYTANLARVLSGRYCETEIFGVDVSKEAILCACRRTKEIRWSVGSVYELPFPESCFDGVISVFAPFAREEFIRVLAEKGLLFMVIPLEEHLWELKCAVYDSPYKNQPTDRRIEGFRQLDEVKIQYSVSLDSTEHIKNLFSMTPYYYNTSPKDRAKLDGLERLETMLSFGLLVYEKE